MYKLENPIFSGFHADPSICCANGEYFIANSTFEWYPGVEIHRSKDLVNWTSVPSPLSENRLLNMAGCVPSCGIWAPCLSYSDGLFWLIYTNVKSWNVGPWKDSPNFLTTAPSIEGPWSDPVFLNASGFDPSLFHDNDGKKYLINMEWDYRNKTHTPFSGLLLTEYDPKQKKLVGEVHKVFCGSDIGLVEGPHLYKRNGWYYIAAAEGGTQYNHAETVARSRSLLGPYEIHPQNPLISSYKNPGLRLQKAGHGSWCTSVDGKHTYFVYLCSRPFADSKQCLLGRETGFAEIQWKDDWPYIMQPDGTLQNTPPEYVLLDTNETAKDKPRTIEYKFDKGNIHNDFKTLRIPMDSERFSLTKRPGFLRLKGGESPISYYSQTLLARRQTDFSFEAEMKMEYNPTSFHHLAGLTYRYDEQTQYLLAVTNDEELGRCIKVLSINIDQFIQGVSVKIPEDGPVYLKVTTQLSSGYFSYSLDGKVWHKIRPYIDGSILSDNYHSESFTGAFVGMFCVDCIAYEKYADVEYFKYTSKD